MAIKVKHTNSVASHIVAANVGGRGARRAKDALALAQMEAQQQQAAEERASRERIAALSAARAGGGGGGGGGGFAPSPGGGGSAPLAHAQAHVSMVSAPTPHLPEFEVTGIDPNKRPDEFSVWNEQTQQWERGRVAYGNWQGALADDRKFTEAQRREVEQLNAVYERARKSGRYTPEELAQIGGQIEERKRAIQPLSSLPEESAQAGFDKRIVTAPGGQKGYIDGRGNFVALPGSPSDVTPEMWNRWYVEESHIKAMGKDEKGEDVPRDRTREEIAQAVANREAEYKKRFAPPPEPDTPATPASPRGTGTIKSATGRHLVLNQDGSITTLGLPENDPYFLGPPRPQENAPQPVPVPSTSAQSFMQMLQNAVPQATLPSDSVDAGEMGGGEDRPQQKKGLILLDQGKNVPPQGDGDSEPRDTSHWEVGGGGNDGGGEESAPPPKKEKKDAE